MQHTNMLRRFCVALGVGGKKFGKTYELFKEREQQELYHCENIYFFLSYYKLTLKTWDRNFPGLSDNAYCKCTKFL
jgi:hypothetical protein